VYIAAGSVYCPLFADNICAVAFSVWPLLLKETLPLCSLASYVEGDSSALLWCCLRHSASSLASLLWRSLELVTSKKRLGKCTRGTFSHIELPFETTNVVFKSSLWLFSCQYSLTTTLRPIHAPVHVPVRRGTVLHVLSLVSTTVDGVYST